MPRFDIEFAVNGQTQTLTVTQRKAIRAGSKNYWHAGFSLDATVAELTPLYATFSREPYHRNRGRAIIVPLEQSDARSGTEYSCQIPWEVLTRKGSVFVGLFAGDMLVTNEVEIEVTEAAPTLGSEGHHTDPWYKPFVDALNRKQDKEAGKGLSANNYTDEDKAKVAGIPANPKYTDTTYTAGDGINIDENNRISVDGGIGADYAPYIGINGNWYEWSDAEGEFIDTGVKAQGEDGRDGINGRDGADGQNGTDGQDGYSPTATVTKSGDTITITITDKNGTTTATVSDGADGQDGQDGQDGFSPTASVVKNNGVITIAITDQNGTTTATLNECDLAFVTTGHSYAQLQTLYEAGKRLVLSPPTTYANDRFIWLNEYTGSSFIFIERGGYGYIVYECLEFVGWQTTTYGLDSAPTQNSSKPVTSGGVYAALGNKQNTISDLDTIRSGAAAGATAVQPAALTAYRTASDQDAIDEAQDTAIAAKYAKPSGGIPKTDLASGVQTSLGKADTAYQKPSGGIPAADLASGVIPSVPSAATAIPSALGTAAVGSSAKYAREDHVHAKPTAADVGAIAAPSSPTSGQFLVYNGSAWVAQTLSTWQGGSY